MSRTGAARALLACVVLMATDAFTLVPLASRSPIIARSMPFPPVRMAADADDKAAAVKAAKKAKVEAATAAKAAKAAEAADAVDEKEETPEEKAAREAAEKAKAEAEAKAKAEAEAKAKAEAERAELEAARAAERKAEAVKKAGAAVKTAGKQFGYPQQQYILRWTEGAIEVGDDNWAALTEEVPDLCDHIGLAKALLERKDAKCVAMVKALDQLQRALTGKLEIPAADLVPVSITIKNRPQGLVAQSYARERSAAREARASNRPNPLGATSWEGGRLW